jgi:hypothetical protein
MIIIFLRMRTNCSDKSRNKWEFFCFSSHKLQSFFFISTNPTVMVIHQWSKQSFQPHNPRLSETQTHGFFFLNKFIGKMLYFSVKKGIIHSHRDLNSVSSSTDKTNLLGSIPSRLRSPDPRDGKTPCASVSSVGWRTSLNLKPPTRNSLELIRIDTGDRDVSTSGVHCWNVSPDESSSTLLSHRLMTRSQSPL